MKYQVIVWRYHLGTIRPHVCLQIDASSMVQKNYKRIAIHREINQKKYEVFGHAGCCFGPKSSMSNHLIIFASLFAFIPPQLCLGFSVNKLTISPPLFHCLSFGIFL